jgi:hypothetical protein
MNATGRGGMQLGAFEIGVVLPFGDAEALHHFTEQAASQFPGSAHASEHRESSIF